MANSQIMPLGFIDRLTEDGAIITLNSTQESRTLREGEPITIWRYHPGQLALAKVRGSITAVGYITATFRTTETRTDPRWPDKIEVLRPGTPVYLGTPGSFEPEPSRTISEELAENLQRLARRRANLARGKRPSPQAQPPTTGGANGANHHADPGG